MMKKLVQPLQGTLLILFIALIFSACSPSSNPGLKYIPKQANIVMSFNIMQMRDKLKDGHFNVDSLMNSLKTQDSAFSLLQYLNLKNPVLSYIQYKSTVMSGQDIVFASIGELSDKSGFEKQLAAIYPGKTIDKKEGFSLLSFDDNGCYVWNDKIVALYGGKNIQTQVPALFALKKEESLADDKNAAKLLSSKGDINLYSGSKDGATGIPMLSMTKISDLLKDNYGGATINFEKGRVVMKGDAYYNSTVTDLIKKNPTKDINKAVLAHYPGKPLGLFQISFNLKQIFSFLDYAGVATMIEGYMKNLGITLDDVAKAFSGDVAVAVGAVNGSDVEKSTPKMLMSIPIGDKSSFDKVMGALAKMEIVTNLNGQWVPKGVKPEEAWSFHSDSKSLVISTDKAVSEAYNSGSGQMVYPKDLDFSGNTSVMYADLSGIFTQMDTIEHVGDSSAVKLAEKNLEDFSFTASNMNGNHATVNVILNLKDKSQNSLPALIGIFQQLNQYNKAREAAVLTDTAFVPPIPKDLQDSGE